jgi:hypothetical protein
VSSPPHPSIVQIELVDLVDPFEHVDPVHLVDVPRDIVVGRQRPTWAHQAL